MTITNTLRPVKITNGYADYITKCRTPTRADAIKTAAELWAGTSPEQMRGSEYLRGQVELIADLFGHDYEADPERETLAEAIITEAQK